MTEGKRRVHDGGADEGIRAWAAVAVRQAQEVWPRARRDPESAESRLVTEHLATVERLLPAEDPSRAAVVCWLGLLMVVRLKSRSTFDPRECAAALNHLQWADRAGPLDDPLAVMARNGLADLLIPPDIPPEVRDGSCPPAVIEILRGQLTDALNVLARVVAGGATARQGTLGEMERVATMLSELPGPPGEVAPATPGEGEETPVPDGAPPPGEPGAEAPTGAIQEMADRARRDAVGFARLLEWLCVTVNDPPVPLADAGRELMDLPLDRPEVAPLRELFAALRSGGQDQRALAERLHGTARAARETLLTLPVDSPERIRFAKFHAALLVAGNLRMPGSLDFGTVDAASARPDPDPAARSLWRHPLSLETVLATSIDNLWVGSGDITRVERSAAWLRQWIDALPPNGAAAPTRRYLSRLLAHRVTTAPLLGGSLQDGATGLAMVRMLPAGEGELDDIPLLLGLHARYQAAHRSRDRAALARAADELIRTAGDRYTSPRSDAATTFMITGMLGTAHRERAEHTGDETDRRAAVRYLREAVAIDPATIPQSLAANFPAVRASLMVELAIVDPRREVIDRAIAEVHRVIDHARASRWDEAQLRLRLGRVLRCAITDRSDLSLLDPCIAELSRVRALAHEGHARPLLVQALTELSAAFWVSAVIEGASGADDGRSSLDTRREALELMAADVLLQLGAEHALSVARDATGHALWLALRCAERNHPADAVEALELGRALVLRTAAATHRVARLLADKGHPDLAERWRAQTPRHPLQQGPRAADEAGGEAGQGYQAGGETGEGHPGGDDPLRSAPTEAAVTAAAPIPGTELPSSLRRTALAALGAGSGTGARELLGTPDLAALTTALAASGADLLVYLVPGEGFRPHIPGHALILRPGGAEPTLLTLPLLLSPGGHQLERYLTAAGERSRRAADPEASHASREAAETEWQAALGELCDWAWPAAMGPVLDTLEPLGRLPRIVLIPCGPLGVVPWHAARDHIPLGGYRYACQDAVFSYAPSGAQFLRAATRGRLPATGPQVLVTDPRLDLMWAEIETEALRSACYPDARRYGGFLTAEGVPDKPGNCEDLLAVLPGGSRPAAVVHISCHGVAGPSPTRSALSLADGELTVARILDHTAVNPGTDGPLVVLSACETDLSMGDHDEALTLSTALVTRGAADVVGSRWAVRDSATALMMTVFHHFLTSQELAPADALRAAQMWMLDPDRRPPPGLTDLLEREATRTGLHEIHLWAAFTHQGNPAPHRTPPGTG
ncbi:CHAT domain-containing protein [Streptomyces sp. NPDC000594]|uniref:CHAT domain-containing protein n=1 Tax=Streptomyces sp. NPDC000594 TaxID=3154261 RepID=UPI00333490F3